VRIENELDDLFLPWMIDNGDLDVKARILDQYYITIRYPDAFANGAPFEYFIER